MDAEFTLNLLQITTKEKELCIKKTDSDFFRDFNASSRVRNSLTNGSEFCGETPDLQQAYQMMAFDFEEFDPTQRRDRGLSHVQPASFKLFPQGSLVNFNANNSAVAFSQNPFKKSKTFYKPNF